jgi:transposase
MRAKKLVFIDETFTKTNMTRLRGRSKRGKRLIDKVPHGHWKTSTFIAALRHNRLTAPFTIDGAVNGEIFLTYIRRVLVPTLRKGDVVAMDNLGSHKIPEVRDAIEAAGASFLYIPPYSPDLNPIEMVFSKIKSVLRKKAFRTVEALWKELGEITKCVSPTECRNYLRHAGYFQSG